MSEKPTPSPSDTDTDTTIFGVKKPDTDTNLFRCLYFETGYFGVCGKSTVYCSVEYAIRVLELSKTLLVQILGSRLLLRRD